MSPRGKQDAESGNLRSHLFFTLNALWQSAKKSPKHAHMFCPRKVPQTSKWSPANTDDFREGAYLSWVRIRGVSSRAFLKNSQGLISKFLFLFFNHFTCNPVMKIEKRSNELSSRPQGLAWSPVRSRPIHIGKADAVWHVEGSAHPGGDQVTFERYLHNKLATWNNSFMDFAPFLYYSRVSLWQTILFWPFRDYINQSNCQRQLERLPSCQWQ